MTDRSRPEVSVGEILAPFPPEVRALATATCRFVQGLVPSAREVPYPGWRAIGFRDQQSGYFCGVFPRQDHVRLLFEHGASLPDPDKLLEGTGKQVRYVVIRRESDLDQAALARLVHIALLHGAV